MFKKYKTITHQDEFKIVKTLYKHLKRIGYLQEVINIIILNKVVGVIDINTLILISEIKIDKLYDTN